MTNPFIRALASFLPKSIMSPSSKSQDASTQENDTLSKTEKKEQEAQLLLEVYMIGINL